jgi:hypothetical protein
MPKIANAKTTSEIKAYLTTIGRRGGRRSKRTLTTEEAREAHH